MQKQTQQGESSTGVAASTLMTRTWFPGEKPEVGPGAKSKKASKALAFGGQLFVNSSVTKGEANAAAEPDIAPHVLLDCPVPKHCNHLLR